MALTLTINGVDKTALLKDASLDIEKVGASESCRLIVLDKNDSTATAYRPAVGDTFRLLHNADLLMGGPIVRVQDERLGGDTGTVTRITVRDWLFLADQVIIEDAYYEGQGALTLFDTLITRYLADKGVTNISEAFTGGPALPALTVQHETLLTVFNRMTEQCGWVFRINGDKECALLEPGTLVGPATLDSSNMLDGWTWLQDEVVTANRFFLQTGTPTSGAGPVLHTETKIADGTLRYFPVNVLPNAASIGLINNAGGYSASAVSVALDGLTKGAVIKANNSFTIYGHASTYVVQSDATVDEQGAVTLSISPGIEEAIDDDTAVRFSPETFITLKVNGVATDLFGSPWVWDEIDQALVNASGTVPANGDEITYETLITFPAWLRVWEHASPSVQTSVGAFDRSLLVDTTIEGRDHTNLEEATEYARVVSLRNPTAPKIVTCTTFTPGWYPYLSTPIEFPNRLIDDTFIVRAVRVRAVSIDPAATTHELPYELELAQGAWAGSDYVAFYRGTTKNGGVRWGVSEPTSVCETVRLSEDWAAGQSDSHVVGHWETSPGGSDPADPLYPEAYATEATHIDTAAGPAGENVLDSSDYSSGGYQWRLATPFNADCGSFQADYRITTAALADMTGAPIFQVAPDVLGSMHVAATSSGGNVSFELIYKSFATGNESAAGSSVTAASVENTWETFRCEWQCGTPTRNASPVIYATAVASDGWVKAWYGDTLVIDVSGIDLCIYEGDGDPVDTINKVEYVALGLYGLIGQVTNIEVRGGSTG